MLCFGAEGNISTLAIARSPISTGGVPSTVNLGQGHVVPGLTAPWRGAKDIGDQGGLPAYRETLHASLHTVGEGRWGDAGETLRAQMGRLIDMLCHGNALGDNRR